MRYLQRKRDDTKYDISTMKRTVLTYEPEMVPQKVYEKYFLAVDYYRRITEEIERRNIRGITDPEGFCDSVNNDDIYWTCECETCVRQTEEYNRAADEWENQCGDEEPEIGNCGFPCDGHCQECDPGFRQRYIYGGGYDPSDEI